MKPRILAAVHGWWLILPTRQTYGRRVIWHRHPTWQDAVDACAAWYARGG